MWRPDFINPEFKQTDTSQISSKEYREIIAHVEQCASCQAAHTGFVSFLEHAPEEEYRRVRGEILRHIEKGGLTERFWERARTAGIQFYDGREWNFQFLHVYCWVTTAALLAMITIVVSQRVWRPRPTLEATSRSASFGVPAVQDRNIQNLEKKLSELHAATISSKREISALKNENSKMLSEISTMGKDLAGRRAENQALQQSLAHLRSLNAELSIETGNNAQRLAHAQAESDEARARRQALRAESTSHLAEVGMLSVRRLMEGYQIQK